MSEPRYVKDVHGHVYIYVEQYYADRIGRGLEFTTRPQTKAQPEFKQRPLRTLQEFREVAAKQGFDIPDGTPFAKAQNMYAEFLAKRDVVDAPSYDLSGIGAFDNAGKAPN